jgi:DNA-binding CsgD family transcriptional regulator
MQRFALHRLNELVPFDTGVLAVGTLQDGVPQPHDVLLDRLPPEFMASWERVRHDDGLIIEAMSNPGRSVCNDSLNGSLYEHREAMKEHSRRWKIMHALCNAQVSPESGLYWVMALSREDSSHPFDESERVTSELVAQHIVAAVRHARLGELRSCTRLVVTEGQAAALINRGGLILEAEPAFAGLVRRAWPSWTGPWIPPELRAAIDNAASGRLVRQRIVVRFTTVDDGVLLQVREAVAADALTEREREIAAAFSVGDRSRDIAEKLGVATNTVRRHLASVYDKLGISSKTELEDMLRGVD